MRPYLGITSPSGPHRAALTALLAAGLCGLWTSGCSARRAPVLPTTSVPPAELPATAVPPAELPTTSVPPAELPAAATVPEAPANQAPADQRTQQEAPPPPRLRDFCRQQTAGDEPLIDDTRRILEETFCGATLWFDSLFGGVPNIENARAVSGRVELSSLYTEVDGIEPRGRLRLRYELPALERRVNLFLGRDDREEVIADRQEGFALRSSVFGLEEQDRWLAGLGYSPPGPWQERVDFRVGARVKSAPEVFAQGRYRRNVFQGTRNVWRFRETVFWENHEGFGATSSLDFDHVLRRDLLFHWGGVGTYSESTEGLSYRTASLLYHNLRRSRAIAGGVFTRGETGADVQVREFGVRTIYRQPIGRPYLFGELIVGYTWPRFEVDEPREGSALLGFGIDLLFGREPY